MNKYLLLQSDLLFFPLQDYLNLLCIYFYFSRNLHQHLKNVLQKFLMADDDL